MPWGVTETPEGVQRVDSKGIFTPSCHRACGRLFNPSARTPGDARLREGLGGGDVSRPQRDLQLHAFAGGTDAEGWESGTCCRTRLAFAEFDRMPHSYRMRLEALLKALKSSIRKKSLFRPRIIQLQAVSASFDPFCGGFEMLSDPLPPVIR